MCASKSNLLNTISAVLPVSLVFEETRKENGRQAAQKILACKSDVLFFRFHLMSRVLTRHRAPLLSATDVLGNRMLELCACAGGGLFFFWVVWRTATLMLLYSPLCQDFCLIPAFYSMDIQTNAENKLLFSFQVKSDRRIDQ